MSQPASPGSSGPGPAPNPLATPLPWDLIAADYEAEIVPVFSRYAAEALRLADLPPGAEVLDVAAGPGTLTLLAARTARRVVAVDFSPGMVERLRQRVAADGLPHVEAQVADGQALPFAAASFDAAFSMFGFIFFPDPDQGYRELARVLRPGRPAVVSSWRPMSHVPVLREIFLALRDALPGLQFGDGRDPLSDPDEVRGKMQAAGFKDVHIHETTHAFEYPSLDVLWASMPRAIAPLVLLRKKLGEDVWTQVARAILTRLGEHCGTGPQRVAMTALIARGVASRNQ
jgi:ubiquinone/menaquinone biosynthesis C-methylase UbiE